MIHPVSNGEQVQKALFYLQTAQDSLNEETIHGWDHWKPSKSQLGKMWYLFYSLCVLPGPVGSPPTHMLFSSSIIIIVVVVVL